MQKVLLSVLLVSCIGSGLAVIYAKHHSRLKFKEMQRLEHALNELDISWERLTLEEKMLSEHNRAESKARKNMGLIDLDRKAIVYIQL